MTVTHSGTGTPTSATGSASSLTPAYPATVNAGEKAVICVNVKPFSATITTPSGFQLVPGATNPATNGSTASGLNTGSTKVAWYESISPCAGTEGGTTVTITVTSADSAGAVIHTAATSLGAWDASVFASGNKVGNSANMSAASGTQTSVAAGDMFYIGFGINASLGTPSTDTLTQTGVTYGTVTNRSDRAITTGNDTRNRVNSVPVTSVTTPSGGATAGYTNASSTSGTVGFLRLRDVSAGPNDGNATGAISWVGVANGARASKGSATGAVAWSGAANGARASRGAATGAVAWSGTASGARVSRGGATGAVSWAGVSNGARVSRGASTGTVVWNGTAHGARPSTGSATGTITWAGVANGEAPTVGGAQGSATGAITWSGVAHGTTTRRGTAAGSIAWAGTATGSRTSVGLAVGTLTWVGIANGITPTIVIPTPTPAERTCVIGLDDRTSVIGSDNRRNDIEADNRTNVIPVDDRTNTIPLDHRTT